MKIRQASACPMSSPAPAGPSSSTGRGAANSSEFDSLALIDRVVDHSHEELLASLALAMAAAVTERIELVTNVVIAPLRGTTMLAKQAASLDRASGGRLTLGVALGARDDDFAAWRTAHRRPRGDARRPAHRKLRRIWRGTSIGPAPARPGGPRVLVGAHARHAGCAGRPARRRLDDDGRHARRLRRWPGHRARGVAPCCLLDRPATMAVVYAALGADAPGLIERAVGGYYAWLGPQIAGHIVGTAATSPTELARSARHGFADAGADEVRRRVLPCSADPAQLAGLAAVALPHPALV